MTSRGLDEAWMHQALVLARQGLYSARPNPRVGCVIVKQGKAVGRGWHPGAGQPHAEVYALRAAGTRGRGATAYVTLEPCSHYGRTPPCADALIAAGIERVVVGQADPDPRVAGSGIARLEAAGISVTTGVLQAACQDLNPGFSRRMTTGLPLLRCKIAQSLDGRTAMASGESQWITGQAARADVQHWRAASDAILTGADTLLADNARLKVRLNFLAQARPDHPELKPPMRLVVDSRLRVPPDHPFYADVSDALVLTSGQAPEARVQALRRAGVRVDTVACTAGGHLAPEAILRHLGDQDFNEVLLESGPTLAGAFARAGLIHEWIFYIAPRLLGSGGLPSMHWQHERLADTQSLSIRDQRQVGADWRIIAVPSAGDGFNEGEQD